MAKPYQITITNGSGSSNIVNDTYTISATVTGYDNTTIDPTSLSVVEGTDSYNLKIAATGTLTLHVSETGESAGTAVVGASFIRCDSEGTTYGSSITTDSNGNAIFNNVPYSSNSTINIYYKQTSSDGNHNFDNTLKNISLSESTLTEEITNSVATSKTINLTDTNYNGLPIENGEITLS